ncbi:UNVERIFIED_CONTAM: hypothetical protein HDU68_005967, partial [Siphonaria sp. JEL0065]
MYQISDSVDEPMDCGIVVDDATLPPEAIKFKRTLETIPSLAAAMHVVNEFCAVFW